MKPLLLFILLTNIAAADLIKENWEKQVYGNVAFKQPDSFFSALVASCSAPRPDSSFENRISLKPTDGWKEPLEAMFHEVKTSKEITVVMPGVFTELDSAHAHRMGLDARALGQNIMVFPNPIAKDVVAKKPPYVVGNAFAEADHYLMFIKKFLDQNPGRYTNINILGVSHGSFVAAIMAAGGAKLGIKVNKILLISPPYQFYNSIVKVDTYLDEVSKEVSFWNKFTDYFFLVRTCLFNNYSSDKKQMFKTARNIVLRRGFHRFFLGSLEAFNPKAVPDLGWGLLSSKYRAWASEQRFSKYLRSFDKELFKRFNSDEGLVQHWLDQFSAQGGKWKVVSTHDDFINEVGAWKESENTIVFKTGGHFAFRGLSNLDKFMLDLYNSY